MKLDCIKPRDNCKGWVVVDMQNGHEISHDERDDCGWAWYKAANVLAEAITEMQRTIYGIGRQPEPNRLDEIRMRSVRPECNCDECAG